MYIIVCILLLPHNFIPKTDQLFFEVKVFTIWSLLLYYYKGITDLHTTTQSINNSEIRTHSPRIY